MSVTVPDGDGQVQVRETEDDDKNYKYSFTYEKATLYEYKFERQAQPDPVDPCYRCNKTVPRAEQIDIGVLFHKQCFRCRICGVPLSLQTYHRSTTNGNTDKDVYCKIHLGKQVGQLKQGDVVGQMELPENPNRKYVIQIEGSKKSGLNNSPKPSPRGSPNTSAMLQASPNTSLMIHSGPNMSHPDRSPNLSSDIRHSPNTSGELRHSPASSMASVTARSLNDSRDTSLWTSYTPQSLDSGYPSNMKQFSHPKPVLQSFDDFENSNVFESQSLLEDRHHEEEERLQRFLSEEREKEFSRLDKTIEAEMEQAASDILASVDNLAMHNSTRSLDLFAERERIEEHFKKSREERLKHVTDKIANEEKTRSSRMLDRHCVEMMTLIGEKDREADRSCLFDHTMRAPLLPPECKKSELFKSPVVFEELDTRAIELANQDCTSYTELVRDLTRGCKSELEKVRVLFRWIIAKDLRKNTAHDILRPNAAVSALFKGVKSGKETYHQLFKKLCTYAGVHCEVILGYSKGAGYKPGMRMDGTAFRNSWTAVCIDGSWRLINCTWAARHVSGHKDDLPQIFHKYDEFYFLTDPEDYIYQHYPDDPAWQLIEIPLPFSEYLNLPVVKSPFFNYGLKFYSNYGATLTTETGMVEIRLVMPKILGYGSLLEPYNKNTSDAKQLDGRTLLRFVKNEAIFTVALPRPGVFYFSIYTGDYSHSECLESACSFLVNCVRLSGPPSPSYPPVPFFGPTPVMEELNITTDKNGVDPLIVCNSDYIELNFKMSKEIKITHTFQYFDVADESVTDIDRYVFLRSRNDTTANYLVRCPKEGFYIFSLFCADTANDTHSLDCAYRYLVICQEPSPTTTAFPKTFHKWNRCTLYEPIAGDLLTDKRYNFRLDVPQAVEVFVVIGSMWHHLKRKLGFSWEANINVGSQPGPAKVHARFQAGRDASTLPQLLEFEITEDVETEI